MKPQKNYARSRDQFQGDIHKHDSTVRGKKGKFVSVEAVKLYDGVGGIVPPILKL